MATRTQGFLIGCVIILATGGFILLALSLLLSGSWFHGGFALGGDGRVGLVLLEGPINESRVLVEEIEANRRDSSIEAVVLRINSPGGEVAPAQEIYHAVRRLAESKPVVASLGSVAASGAFYAAVAADSIVADPGSLVGSIGVIIMYPTAGELLSRVGVEMRVYKSGRLKDMGSFARAPTEEEEIVFDSIIADVYDQFVDAVAEGRRLERERVLALGDGRVFSGRQAREVGLIDRLGDFQAAVDLAADLAGLAPDPDVVRKARRRPPFLDVLERLLRDGAHATWGPRIEYRLR